MSQNEDFAPFRCVEQYARMGWKVIPVHTIHADSCTCGNARCPSPGKHPLWKGWPQRASSDLDVLWECWSDFAYNVGIVTGAPSGIVVLDIDPRNGGDEAFQRLVEDLGPLESYYEVATGGGGRHLYFADRFGRESSRKLGPGLDIKGSGGFVVAPPSIHISGARYRWLDSWAGGIDV